MHHPIYRLTLTIQTAAFRRHNSVVAVTPTSSSAASAATGAMLSSSDVGGDSIPEKFSFTTPSSAASAVRVVGDDLSQSLHTLSRELDVLDDAIDQWDDGDKYFEGNRRY